MRDTKLRRVLRATFFLLAGLAPAALAQDPVASLKELLGKNDPPPEAVEAALQGAIDAAAADAVPAVFHGVDSCCESLSKHEVDAARSSATLEAKKEDAKQAEDAKVAFDKARGSASGTQRTLDVLTDGMPKLLDAVAAKSVAASVPVLLGSYEAETRRVDELQRQDEELKGKLAQASSKVFSLEQDK